MRRLLLFTLFVVVVAVARCGFGVGRPGTNQAVSPATASASSSAPPAGGPDTPQAPLSAAPSTSPTAAPGPDVRENPGRTLAQDWLRAFLTRSSRDDTDWVEVVKPLSTPDLVDALQAPGPDLVGLDQLNSWRVAKVEPIEAIDPPPDTASRRVLAYAAVVTDGTHTVEKPFELYAFRQPDSSWLIGMVDQPYSSEG